MVWRFLPSTVFVVDTSIRKAKRTLILSCCFNNHVHAHDHLQLHLPFVSLHKWCKLCFLWWIHRFHLIVLIITVCNTITTVTSIIIYKLKRKGEKAFGDDSFGCAWSSSSSFCSTSISTWLYCCCFCL